MATPTSYPHGTPSWVDHSTPDVEKAKTFYAGLFDWTTEDDLDDDGNVIYTEFHSDGLTVAGLNAQPETMQGMPPVWHSYVAVDDADAVVAKVEPAGGAIIAPVMQVMEAGRFAFFADPTGAVIGVWEAGTHTGAAKVNAPNSYSWNELLDRDLDTALPFYTDVFGWEWQTMDMPQGPYHVVAGGENGGLAGAMAMPPEVDDQVPNHWGVYFTVADADATCARAVELGGTIGFGPDDTPVGRLAMLHDDQGGAFNIMQHPDPTD